MIDTNHSNHKEVCSMPKTNQNLIGKQFGHLTVIEKADKRGNQNQYLWVCRCDCGKKTVVSTSALNSGQISSCGHVRMEKSVKNLKPSKDRHMKQLNNRPPVTSKTGYRNISLKEQNGKKFYLIAVMYDKKQHSKVAHSLEEALAVREELREQWWPNYHK
jgi:hypothetical protein